MVKLTEAGNPEEPRRPTHRPSVIKLDGRYHLLFCYRGLENFRGGENAISNAKFENDEVSFDVVVEFNGNSRAQKYHGKLDGNAITGTIQMQRRNGENRELEWNAERDS